MARKSGVYRELPATGFRLEGFGEVRVFCFQPQSLRQVERLGFEGVADAR
jgi:hypothetical protein